MDDPNAGTGIGLRSTPVDISSGAVYEGSVYVFTESGQASLYLEFWDAGGTRIFSEFRTNALTGSWQLLDLRGTAPEDAVSASLLVYSPAGNVGISHFDDASLLDAVPLDVDLFGPASLTAAVRGGVLIEDSMFISSRFNTPEGRLRLAEFDINSADLLSVADLPIDSSGGQKLASDGRYVYIGPAGNSHIWRYDPQSGEAQAWAQVGSDTTWYYAMTVADEYLYLGTYPDCIVARVRLSDATVQTYGRVSESLYATAVVVDENNVYGGSAAPGSLLRWPKDGGEPTDLTPYLSDSPVGILAMARSNGLLYIASGRQLISIRPDGSDRVVREIPEEDRYIDQLTTAPDGTVYALARLTTNHYEVTPTGLRNVGQPFADVENQALAATPEGQLIGVSGLGHIWNLEPDGEAEVWDTATRGFGYPEVAQTMLLHSRQRVWVAGHYAMTVHQPASGDSVRFDIDGEPKALAEGRRGIVYAGLYPSAQIVGIDPNSYEITPLGLLGNQQMRTRAMHYDASGHQLLVASGPSGGLHTGALTFVDLGSNDFEVHREYLPDQSVMGVAVSGRTAYIVGDTYGEGTSGPIRGVAQVAAIDLDSRELLWREELDDEWESYEDVHVVGNTLYLMARRPRGRWFALDLDTDQVVAEGDLGGYGSFGGAHGRIYSWVHWALDIRELPSEFEDNGKLLHSGVPEGWYNNPRFNFTRDGESTWGMWGTELARFSLVH